ncbi:sugar ABC transporter ATP-binding protein [Alphaproteobacteria bacterium KMM 3653]|uniref:Sugar ABC transporter ATP-binding protein n=1 Tax=Harenicola maris TaxID=2841044 RepID=A0AAP2CP85_9RHOB|nr:sugar ABC transporter ATP-binding protein [Harenicola maris]
MTAALFTARGIRRTFGPTVALADAEITLYPGEVHAIMGENGSGKSTLLSILSGALEPDEGQLTYKGQGLSRLTSASARDQGIAVVQQEPQLSPDLTVAENILLGRLPTRLGRIDWPRVYARAGEVLAELDLDLDPLSKVSTLSIGRRQMVEIAKGIADAPNVLLLDEATSSLDEADTNRLFALVDRLKARGTAIAFVSHRMSEVTERADRATVLRDGHYIGTTRIDETDEHSLVAMMVGRDLKSYWHKVPVEPGEDLLTLTGVSRNTLSDLNMRLRSGEIIGLAGLVGSGRSALLRTIAGVRPASTGEVRLNGTPVQITSPGQARRLGIGYVPEDRKAEGLVMGWSLLQNASLSKLGQSGPFAMITRAFDRAAYTHGAEGLGIKTHTPEQAVSELSGGNQQKVVIARELATGPRLLLLDEPTRGVDVGAKEDIYAQISTLVQGGMGLIIASSELQELMGVCDRILVLFQGRIVAEIPAAEATEQSLAYWASGAHEIADTAPQPEQI